MRIALGPDGSLQFGRTLAGRGAWLCSGSSVCARLAARRNAFGRALRAQIAAPVVERLVDDLEAAD